MNFKRLISVLLVAALLLANIGCVQKDSDGNSMASSTASSVGAQSQQADFDAYLAEAFREIVGDNLFDSRFYLRNPEKFGITDIPITIGSIDFEELDNAEELWQEDYDEITAFKYDELTKEQQLIYDIILNNLNLSQQALGLEYYSENNSPLLGIQSQLPSLLGEFKLYTVQDAYDYITMVESTPLYFADMLKYQQLKSEKGLFMNDRQLEATIQSCKSFTENVEQHILIHGFKKRIDTLPGITQADITKLEELNKKAILEKLIPAYENFITGISALKGTGKNEGGLCGLPEGKKYYECLVKSITGSERTVRQMAKMIDNELDVIVEEIDRIISDDPKVFDRWDTAQVDITDPMEILGALQKRSTQDFPPLRDLQYQVKYVDPSMEENSSPAFYIIPQVDNNDESSIYINGMYKDDINALFTTMSHEGYPGHMYQMSYFQELNPNPIRRMLSCGGYSEGWATYVEQLSYEMMGLDDPQLTVLMQDNNIVNLMLSCRVDIGVNYEGWSVEDTKNYLSNFGVGEDEIVEDIRAAVIEDPANYLQYGVGLLEFQKLRRYAEIELDENFSAMAFHKAILDMGPAPFPLVRKAVEQYVGEAQATAEAATGASTKAA